jgi:PIN domain nuclease of toxin-antitoxin system
MKALLDTNAFLWWLGKKDRLTAQAYEIIQDPENEMFLSVACVWEIIIKTRSGKLMLPDSPELYIPSRIAHYGFQLLPIEIRHVLQLWTLAEHHRDPFDRILVAQSQVEQLPIITSDQTIPKYSVQVIW